MMMMMMMMLMISALTRNRHFCGSKIVKKTSTTLKIQVGICVVQRLTAKAFGRITGKGPKRKRRKSSNPINFQVFLLLVFGRVTVDVPEIRGKETKNRPFWVYFVLSKKTAHQRKPRNCGYGIIPSLFTFIRAKLKR